MLKRGMIVMKKMLRAAAAALAVCACLALPAQAAKGFDPSVLANRTQEGVILNWDKTSGNSLTSMTPSILSDEKAGWAVAITPMIVSNEVADGYFWSFLYYGDEWASIESIDITVGGTTYRFSGLLTSRDKTDDGRCAETAQFAISPASGSFIADVIAHQSEKYTVSVTLNGQKKSIAFTLPQATKDQLIHLYNLYAAAGGARSANMDAMESLWKTYGLKMTTRKAG